MMGGGGVKYCQKLCDVIYGRPILNENLDSFRKIFTKIGLEN